MFQLFLIRHAQSANNALPESQRVPDPGLTELGHQQASALARWMLKEEPTSLYCSGFRRALETAQPVAKALNLAPTVRFDLFEQGGCYAGYQPGKKSPATGMGRSQIRQAFGDWSIDDRITDLGWYHGQELESEPQAIRRAKQVANWIHDVLMAASQNGQSHRPALIIHADFKGLLLDALRQKQPTSTFHEGNDLVDLSVFWNTSITRLTWLDQRWRVDAWNAIPHLASHQATC